MSVHILTSCRRSARGSDVIFRPGGGRMWYNLCSLIDKVEHSEYPIFSSAGIIFKKAL